MPHMSIELPQVLHHTEQLQDMIRSARQRGQTIGLVPTMGALHDGHLSLVKLSDERCDVTVVSIFVNPTQFGPGEDLAKYPRTLDADMEKLAELGVDIVFAPPEQEIYRPDHSTYVEPPSVAEPLEGRCRPGHFRGVATVVLKLFHLAPAHYAYFGQKDYQQVLVIEQMVRDLNVPIEICVCPTVRDRDGLALSSRNRLLTEAERARARALPESLQLAQDRVDAGEIQVSAIRETMVEHIRRAGIELQYAAFFADGTMDPVHTITATTVVAVAARVGQVRLIDNERIGPDVQ